MNDKGEIVGYNKEKVEELRDKINDIAQDVASDVVELLHDRIVVPISTEWYAEVAQEYFLDFKDQVKQRGEAIKKAFDDFRKQIEETGKEWALATQGKEPVLLELDDVDLNLDVSSIQNADESGNRYINEDGVNAIIDSIESVEEDIKSKLSNKTVDLGIESAFLGDDQAKAIQSCFDKILNEIHILFDYLLSGDNSLSNALLNYKNSFSELAQSNTTVYNNEE